jgi:hypothetical protein
MLERAADVERTGGQRAAEVGVEGRGVPDGAGGEESGQDAHGAERRSAQGSHGGGFFSGIANPLLGDGGLDLEDGVDAFGGDEDSGVVREQERRIEVIKDRDVDLARAAAGGIDDESGSGAVAAGQIAAEELEPVVLGGGSGGGGVLEQAADGELGQHLALDAAEDFAEVELSGVDGSRHA